VPDFAGLAIVAKVSHHPVALGPMGSRSSPIFLVEKLARHKNAERRRRPRACRRQPAKPSDDEASEIVTSRGRVRLPGASESALALKWIVVAYKPLNLPLTVSDAVKFSALFASCAVLAARGRQRRWLPLRTARRRTRLLATVFDDRLSPG
jgi:hypothetical protein